MGTISRGYENVLYFYFNKLKQLEIMKISEVEIGHEFEHRTKGRGIIIAKTKRTLTAFFKICTTKVTYKSADAYFSPSDF